MCSIIFDLKLPVIIGLLLLDYTELLPGQPQFLLNRAPSVVISLLNPPPKDFDHKNPLLKFNIRLLHKLDLSTQLQKKLESLYVDNPLQFWDNNKIYATLKLKDPNKIIRVKPMRHNELDIKEFQQQLNELSNLKLIRPCKSPHSSPTFMVRNRNEIN